MSSYDFTHMRADQTFFFFVRLSFTFIWKLFFDNSKFDNFIREHPSKFIFCSTDLHTNMNNDFNINYKRIFLQKIFQEMF